MPPRPDREPLGDLVVRQLADHAQLEGLALVPGEVVESGRERESGREPLVDVRVPILGGEVDGQPEALTGACLDAIVADRFAKDVAGDPEEPGKRGAAVFVAEAVPSQPRLRERLRCQVAGGPFEPAATPRVDPQGVPLVQHPEGLRVHIRCPDQLRVRADARVDSHASL